MTAYTPTTEIGKAMLHLRHMLALSATFQAAVGDYATAFNRVFYEGPPDEKLIQIYNMEPLDMSLPLASVWPQNVRFAMPSPDIVREVGGFHVYMRWPTNLVLYTDWNDRLLHAFDSMQAWAKEVCELSSLADDSDDGPIVDGESHLAISMAESPFNEHTPLDIRPPGATEELAFQNKHPDFQFRHMVVSVGDGEGGQ